MKENRPEQDELDNSEMLENAISNSHMLLSPIPATHALGYLALKWSMEYRIQRLEAAIAFELAAAEQPPC